MSLNLEAMREVVHDLYVTAVLQQHGDEGGKALRKLLASLRIIYQHLDPESIGQRLIVFKALSDADHPLPRHAEVRVQQPESLAQEHPACAVIQVLENGEFCYWRELPSSLDPLAQVAVVYEYVDRNEYFLAKAERRMVVKLDQAYASMFAIPTFSSLREALSAYRTRLARNSTCEILQRAWDDGQRLFFKTKPEATMRKSLTQFLLCTLRGAEVRPEQIVDESHPVDIKVTWMFCNRLALIEIKWLGDSRGEDGKITTTYRQSRARDGAKQLADYLDANRIRAPEHRTRGYLAIFDARRRGLKDDSVELTRSDGFHHDKDEIVFDPVFHQDRDDFEEPVRFFLEPKCA